MIILQKIIEILQNNELSENIRKTLVVHNESGENVANTWLDIMK